MVEESIEGAREALDRVKAFRAEMTELGVTEPQTETEKQPDDFKAALQDLRRDLAQMAAERRSDAREKPLAALIGDLRGIAIDALGARLQDAADRYRSADVLTDKLRALALEGADTDGKNEAERKAKIDLALARNDDYQTHLQTVAMRRAVYERVRAEVDLAMAMLGRV